MSNKKKCRAYGSRPKEKEEDAIILLVSHSVVENTENL
jgi:hypothetical protein